MEQVKIFQGYYTEVKMEINNFICKNKIEILDIQLSTTSKSNSNTITTVLLFYREKENKEENM